MRMYRRDRDFDHGPGRKFLNIVNKEEKIRRQQRCDVLNTRNKNELVVCCITYVTQFYSQ